MKADKLYSIVVDEKMSGILGAQSEENENEEDREEDKRTLELINKEGVKREGNVSEGSNGWKSKKRPRLKMEEEGGLGGNCVSSKLLVRTQQWKKDGALLVRNFDPVGSSFPDFSF